MSGVVLNGSTSGSVTLDPPAVAGSTVITLPSTSGTMITTASSGQSIPKAALPTGTVLQVVQATTTGAQVSTSSTSYVTSSFSVTITPSSSTSKVLINYSGAQSLNPAATGLLITIYRNATDLGATNKVLVTAGYIATSPINAIYLDSPATTSATTYTLYYKSVSGTVFINANDALSTLTATEIAA